MLAFDDASVLSHVACEHEMCDSTAQRHELYIIFSIHSDTTIVSPIDWLEGIVSSKNLFLITANGQHPLPQDAGLVLELFMVQAIRVDWLSSLFSRPSRKRLTTS